MGSLLAQQRGVRCQAFKSQGPAGAQAAPRALPRDQPRQLVGQFAAGLLGTAAALSLALAPPALAVEPFLKSTGKQGFKYKSTLNSLYLSLHGKWFGGSCS